MIRILQKKLRKKQAKSCLFGENKIYYSVSLIGDTLFIRIKEVSYSNVKKV